MRSAPAIDPGNIVHRLPRGSEVELLDGPDANGWARVRFTAIDGRRTGWVSAEWLEPITPTAPPLQEPAWLAVARAEEGVTEHPGPAHNPRIVAYHATTTLKATTDETPWCSSFVNWCVMQAGLPGTRSAAARSWLKWGRILHAPEPGCITVFRRGSNPNSGHVAFFLARRGAFIDVLGGNQSNSVRVSAYRAVDLLAYRWP